ncbi:MAG: N-6 DNA methylase [Sphingobacteriales bacterium JAD_PAG50586_3]|nr:MAG: N-6 DNA methylase [Sphingobacteriales bacterium JAD_PAG50586_3]
MKDLSNITTWQNSFGLLPIHLRPVNSESNFVLLNGGYGDFCLQTNKSDASPEDYFSESWSSNTKNFIVINNNKTEIYNWQKNNVEIISNEQVSKNFDKFYTYLLSKSYKSERDVIPFIIDIFRQFRNLTREKTNPTEALNLLFLLLTSLEENLNINIDFEKWGIKETSIPSGFGYYVDRLKENNIKPHLDLIIRHSSGALFQEAQKEVLFFNPQMELFGGVSNKLNSKENLYSSVHYTPAYIARTIVENALEKLDLSKTNIKIFDPACGSCEFLIEALKQLKEKNYNGSVQIVGWDTSATAVNTSTFLLTFEKRKVWGDKLTFNIELVTDSLLKKWDEDYDLILMNPPFVSWELLESKEARDAVKETLNINFSGRPNQASAFFYKSVKSLSNHGVIGCVIPSSLLTLDSYKKLRSDINEQLSINLIAKLGNFIFEDALTDVSILVGHKPKINDLVPTILWSRNEKGIANEALRDLRKMNYTSQFTINKIDYSIFQPIQFPIVEDSWRPISVTQNQLLKKVNRFVIDKKLYPVKDIFKVQQGINSGNNVFKINKEEYLQLPKNEQLFLGQ